VSDKEQEVFVESDRFRPLVPEVGQVW